MNLIKSIFGCILLFTLNGCISLLPEAGPPSKLYTLAPVSIPVKQVPPLPLHVIVDRPFTYHFLDATKIALYEKEDGQPSVYTFIRNHEWVERLPFLLHGQVIEGFEKATLFKSVSRSELAEEGDLIVQLEVRNFEVIVFNNQATAHICLAAKILRASDQRILASYVFDQQQPADRKRFAAIMRAIDKGWTTLLNDLIRWTYQEAQSYIRKQASRR